MVLFGVTSDAHHETYEAYPDEVQRSHICNIWTCFWTLLFLFILFTGILGGYHAYLLISGQTTWEHASRMNVTYLRPYKSGILPFYEGMFGNLKSAFCHGGQVREWDLLDPKELLEKQGFNWCENEYWSCC